MPCQANANPIPATKSPHRVSQSPSCTARYFDSLPPGFCVLVVGVVDALLVLPELLLGVVPPAGLLPPSPCCKWPVVRPLWRCPTVRPSYAIVFPGRVTILLLLSLKRVLYHTGP